VEGKWSASRPCRFTPGEKAPGTHWIGGWVDPRVGLDDMENIKFLTLLGLELRPVRRPARSQSLYRLSYLDDATLEMFPRRVKLRVNSSVTRYDPAVTEYYDNYVDITLIVKRHNARTPPTDAVPLSS
jgi:hypothetical protein